MTSRRVTDADLRTSDLLREVMVASAADRSLTGSEERPR